MTDKRIPLYAQYGYAKVKEITPEQWEAFRKTPYTATTEEPSVTQKTPLDAQQIIKAAVQAIEDIMPGTWDNECWVCRRYLLTAGTSSKNPRCLSCDILSLKPHLQALKGLIDD